MATLRIRSGNYYLRFSNSKRRPKEKWVPLQCKDRRTAEREKARIERDYDLGYFDPWKDSTPDENPLLSSAIQRFLRSRVGCRPKTIEAYASILRCFAATLPPDFKIRMIDVHHLSAFLSEQQSRRGTPLSQASRYKRFNHLRVFFSWATEQMLVMDNPMMNLRPVKPSKKVAAFLRPEDVERLVRCIRADAEIKETEPEQITWLIDVVLVAVSTGLRLGELVNLRWENVDLDTRFLTIRSGVDFRTKSGHERRVPIAGDALTILRRLEANRRSPYVFTGLNNGGRLNPNYVSRRFAHYRKLAMLPDGISFHSLRHTCASWLVMKGVSLPIVQGILGHSSLSVTQRYAHLAPDSLQKEMDRVFVAGLAR